MNHLFLNPSLISNLRIAFSKDYLEAIDDNGLYGYRKLFAVDKPLHTGHTYEVHGHFFAKKCDAEPTIIILPHDSYSDTGHEGAFAIDQMPPFVSPNEKNVNTNGGIRIGLATQGKILTC